MRNYLREAEKVKMALRFKQVFTKSAELGAQKVSLATGFPLFMKNVKPSLM